MYRFEEIRTVKDDATGNTLQISAMGQQLAGLTAAVYGGKYDLDDMKRRVARLERRLELNDPAH